MAHVGDLIVTGTARCLNDIHAPGITTLKYSGAQTSGGYVGGTLKSNSTSEDDAITIEAGTNMTLKAYSLTNTLVLSAVDTTYSSKAAASGGTDVSLVTTGEKYTWNNKTSNTGTVTSITLKATSPISIDSSSAITTSGTRTLSHANSGVTAGTYQSVTVNATGHVTAGAALTKAQVTTALGYTPPTSDTNTTYTLSADTTNNKIKLTPSSGTAQSITVPYATSAGSATSAGKLSNTAKIGDTNKPVYFTANGVPEAISYTIAKSVPSDAVFTDTNTKVTSVGNHYAPAADTSAQLSASASGATAAWSIDVVKGVQLQRDAKGHVTGVTVTSGKIPANPNTDAKVKQTATDSTDANYELLFSATADNTTRTEGARKSSKLYFNPYYNYMFINSGDTGRIMLDGSKGQIDLTGQETAQLNIRTSTDETKRLALSHFDINCYGTTWDGTNTSLKTALSKKLGNTGSQTITNGSMYISTSTITTGVGFFAKNRNNIQCYLYCGDDSMGLYSDNGHGGIIRKFLSTNEVAINGATYSVANPANFRSAIGAAASSSRLTKKNIEDITEAEAKKILDIDVKSFDYKDAYILEGYPKRDKYYGVIAEDVLKQIPFVVNVPDDYDESKIDETRGLNQSLLTVDYDKFVPYLIKMVQIQQKEIEYLKQQLNKITK